MRRYTTILLMLLFLPFLWQYNISAVQVRTHSTYEMEIREGLTVSEIPPRCVITVYYPDGSYRLYYDPFNMPSSLTVPVGSRVKAQVFGRTDIPGSYRLDARGLTSDLPSSDYVTLTSYAHGNPSTGDYEARAEVTVNRYTEGMWIILETNMEHVSDSGRSSMSCGLTVRVQPPEIITATLVLTETTSQSTSTSRTRTTTWTPASTTQTQETTATTGSTLTVTPKILEVTAGDTAWFNITTSLSSPIIRVENLPTGYRYVITKGEGVYFLRIFTHPYSYGRFDISVIAESGGVELSESVRLIVKERRITQTTQETQKTEIETQGEAITSTSVETSAPEVELTISPTIRETAPPVVTTITVVKEEHPLITDIALGGLAGILVLLLILLLVRRRR